MAAVKDCSTTECACRKALADLLAAIKIVSVMHGREFVDLGTQVNTALAAPCECELLRAELTAIERAVGFSGNRGELVEVISKILTKRDEMRAERDLLLERLNALRSAIIEDESFGSLVETLFYAPLREAESTIRSLRAELAAKKV